jgi:hypothetical protein
MMDNGTPTPIAAIAYKKILKTSFGMADLDNAGPSRRPRRANFHRPLDSEKFAASTARLSVFAIVATTLAR